MRYEEAVNALRALDGHEVHVAVIERGYDVLTTFGAMFRAPRDFNRSPPLYLNEDSFISAEEGDDGALMIALRSVVLRIVRVE